MTQFQKLQQVVNNPKAYGLTKTSNAYASVKELLNRGKSYTAQSSYSLGWANKSDWTTTVEDILKKIGIAYEVCNDAPRGGANGKHIVLTGKAILRNIKKINSAPGKARAYRDKATKEVVNFALTAVGFIKKTQTFKYTNYDKSRITASSNREPEDLQNAVKLPC